MQRTLKSSACICMYFVCILYVFCMYFVCIVCICAYRTPSTFACKNTCRYIRYAQDMHSDTYKYIQYMHFLYVSIYLYVFVCISKDTYKIHTRYIHIIQCISEILTSEILTDTKNDTYGYILDTYRYIDVQFIRFYLSVEHKFRYILICTDTYR